MVLLTPLKHTRMHEKLHIHRPPEEGGEEQSEQYITSLYYIIKIGRGLAGRYVLNICEQNKEIQKKINCLISRIKFHNSVSWSAFIFFG